MTNRKGIVLNFFHKNGLLKINSPIYKEAVYDFFSWLIKEDDVKEDQTSNILPIINTKAQIISKDNINIIVAGLEEVNYFFGKDIIFDIKIPEGKIAKKNDVIAVLSGKSNTILSLERTILNILQRMSGIATQTNFFVEKIKKTPVAATRKTPWMLLDKKAVAIGGGITHRLNLNDGILIKDNHLEIIKKEYDLASEAQAVSKVLKLALQQNHESSIIMNNIEIEVNTVAGAISAIETFSKFNKNNYLTIMFDNWEPEAAQKFIAEQKIPADINNKILFEASGNITEKNIAEWGKTPVDFISMGSLTHSVKAADLSMEII